METAEKKLTEKQKDFFNKLSLYIDKPIYFYGSITRDDYLPGQSDIDVDIFTDNEQSTIQLLSNYLNIDKNEFNKTIYKINKTSLIYGYKIKYQNSYVKVEISIYNNKYKNQILYKRKKTNNISFFIYYLLFVIKYIYYNLGIIPNSIYKTIKRHMMNENAEVEFLVLD
jgi:predicted nucleotidyltransferase